MLDFNIELEKLLAGKPTPADTGEFTAIVGENRKWLSKLNRRHEDLSMQVEELYEMMRGYETDNEALKNENDRANKLLRAVIALSDIIEDFYTYARNSGQTELTRQAFAVWKNAGEILRSCGVTRLGKVNCPLDPDIHHVQAAMDSDLPREWVSEVLQSGYRHQNKVLRKAMVVVSTGIVPKTEEDLSPVES